MSETFPQENDPKIQEYRRFVLNRECTKEEEIRVRLDHSITGMVTEAGELSDLMKKIKFYKASIPRIKFLDEMADQLHYLVMGMNALNVSFEDLMRLNMAKLRARSPNEFTPETAINKDKTKEQKAIESEMEDKGEKISNE